LFTFLSNDSGLEIACVQVSLTNGVTTQLQAIPWATGAIAILIILASGASGLVGYAVKGATVHPTGVSPHAGPTAQAHATGGDSGLQGHAIGGDSGLQAHAGGGDQGFQAHGGDGNAGLQAHAVGGDSGPPAHNMDPTTLFLHFQSISTSGLLSLNYPPIYRAFTVNFAWSNFIIPLTPFRHAAQRMRKCDLDTPTSTNVRLSQLSVPPVSSNEAPAGIPAYAAKLGISEQDIFGIAYFVFLCAFAAVLVIFVLVGLVIQMASSMADEPERKEAWFERRTRWRQISSNNTLRIVSHLVTVNIRFS
jgi:hypothetical protein